MGKYINQINGINMPSRGKADILLANGATEILKPKEYRKDLVCVVDNGTFEAAGYVFDEEEFMAFSSFDGRPKRWFVLPGVESYV